MKKSTQAVLTFAFGAVFLGVLAYAALRTQPITNQWQFWLLRTIAAVSVAAVAAMIPGFIHLTIGDGKKTMLRAGGAMGFGVLIYVVNPPGFANPAPPKDCQHNQTRECACSEPGKRIVQVCLPNGSWGECDCPNCGEGTASRCFCEGGISGEKLCEHGHWGDCVCQGAPKLCRDGENQDCKCRNGESGTKECNEGLWTACACGTGRDEPQSDVPALAGVWTLVIQIPGIPETRGPVNIRQEGSSILIQDQFGNSLYNGTIAGNTVTLTSMVESATVTISQDRRSMTGNAFIGGYQVPISLRRD